MTTVARHQMQTVPVRPFWLTCAFCLRRSDPNCEQCGGVGEQVTVCTLCHGTGIGRRNASGTVVGNRPCTTCHGARFVIPWNTQRRENDHVA